MSLNIKNKLLIDAQLIKSDLLDFKKFSFFLKKNNYSFSFYSYKKLYQQLNLLIYLLKQSKSKGCKIIFMGLSKKDHTDYLVFNNILKKLVVMRGHIYADSKFNGFLYNRWSLYKRRSNPSDFFLSLQKNNKLPLVLFSFSKETDGSIFREFNKFGIPIIYLLEGSNHFEFKDYPILGAYSRQMLNFYLNILKYCLN